MMSSPCHGSNNGFHHRRCQIAFLRQRSQQDITSQLDMVRTCIVRDTKKKEDKAYCLLGIFNVFMPLIYGEGDNASVRLREELEKTRK